MKKICAQSGLSLIDLVLVIVIISIVATYYLTNVRRPLRQAYSTIIKYQAGIFNRNINILRTISSTNNQNYVEHQGTQIFFNEFGWPANTVAAMSPHSSNQTEEECRQLWQGIFLNPLKASAGLFSVRRADTSRAIRYKISSKNSRACRYQLVDAEKEYFFDYDLRTGMVVTFFDEE